MSAGLESIHEFPEDDALWFIKWIDEFRLPHLGTRSASVSVILQKLPFTKVSELSRLNPEALLQILGQRANKDQSIELLRPAPLVMPGTLPLLHIGAVYQNKVKVGELPTRNARIELLSDAPRSAWGGKEITLGDQLPPPPGWIKEVPYYTLNRYEYSMVSLRMPRSRCWLLRRGQTTYVIPHMTIFKTFYACHTELAKAFCNGPWNQRYHDLICMSDLKSGLKTEITSSGQWNVIVQTLVPDTYAELLALFYFDPYARACAESIFATSLQDRRGRMQAPWYASARIPFKSNPKNHLLNVRGFPLRSWKYKDEDSSDSERHKFLVTEIVASSWPNDIPMIGYERANSGNAGENSIEVNKPKPYQKTKRNKPGDANTEVNGEHDADDNAETRSMNATEFSWLNKVKKKKLEKKSSKQYTEERRPLPPTSYDKTSTGEHTNQQDSIGKGTAEIIIREPEKRFDHIYDVFRDLTKSGFITSMRVFPCTVTGKRIRRGEHDCWSFIDEESRKYGYRPRRGWRMAEFEADNLSKCKYRSALIMELLINGSQHYWIEIECKGKEGGFRSPLLSNLIGDPTEVMTAALEIIAEHKGNKLKAPLNDQLRDYGVIADGYKHIYESKDSSKLDIESVKRFLNGR